LSGLTSARYIGTVIGSFTVINAKRGNIVAIFTGHKLEKEKEEKSI
jgi:hypothetical protein